MTSESRSAADESAWPLVPAERTWSPFRLAVTLVTASAATWCYLIGESVGQYLNFVQGSFALTAGCMIGMLLVLLAAGPMSARFGVDSIAGTKPSFGSRGWVVPAALQAVSIIGWNSLLIIFFAKSAVQLAIVLGLTSADSVPAATVPMLTLSACCIVFAVLRRGASGVSMVSNVLVAHVFVGLWMLYLLVSHRWPELLAAQPAGARPDRLWNYTTGVELGITTTLSWWPYIGAMIRMAPNARAMVLPVMLGMGAPVPLLSLIGLAGVLVLKSSDPSLWLRSVGGPTYAIVSLAFVAAANFGSFLALIGVAFAPLCGIQIADYYVLRRRRIDVRALYLRAPGSTYYYWKGFNPAALIALVAGCGAYLALLNPLTYASAPPYRFLTASLPCAAAAALVYLVMSRIFAMGAARRNSGQ